MISLAEDRKDSTKEELLIELEIVYGQLFYAIDLLAKAKKKEVDKR